MYLSHCSFKPWPCDYQILSFGLGLDGAVLCSALALGCMALITDTRLHITSELDKNVNESVLRSSFFNRSKTCTQQIYLIYLNLITDGDKTANFVSALASYIF